MRQLGRPLGKASKSEMSERRNYRTTGINRRRTPPTRPPGRSGPPDRTAGGIGGAAPASLDLYGQSRIICGVIIPFKTPSLTPTFRQDRSPEFSRRAFLEKAMFSGIRAFPGYTWLKIPPL